MIYHRYREYYMLLYTDNTEDEYLANKITFLLDTELLPVCIFRF